jgi:hypothetical protein
MQAVMVPPGDEVPAGQVSQRRRAAFQNPPGAQVMERQVPEAPPTEV